MVAGRASLLRRDSVHGPFDGTITIDEANNTITANGNLIQVIYAKSPTEVDYTQYGIENALLVDNTGKWRDAEGLGQLRHFAADIAVADDAKALALELLGGEVLEDRAGGVEHEGQAVNHGEAVAAGAAAGESPAASGPPVAARASSGSRVHRACAAQRI